LGCANVSVVRAGSESLKLIVVPTGARRVNLGSSEPRRKVEGLTFALDTAGEATLTVAVAVLFAGLVSPASLANAAACATIGLAMLALLVCRPARNRAAIVKLAVAPFASVPA
jgi:hypothetical protein